MSAAPPAPVLSPLRSTLAVLAGFGLNFFLAGAGSQMLAALAPGLFPAPGPDGPPALGTVALALITLLFAANGTLAGVLTGRLSQVSPVSHTAILAGIFGLLGLWGLDQARGYPGWFAIAFVVVPPACALFGGLIARRAAAMRAARAPKITSVELVQASADEKAPPS